MYFPSTTLILASLSATLFAQPTAATCRWGTCCYVNHNGPAACPPSLWHVTLTASFCEISICPFGCNNPVDGSACDCCDVVTGECRSC